MGKEQLDVIRQAAQQILEALTKLDLPSPHRGAPPEEPLDNLTSTSATKLASVRRMLSPADPAPPLERAILEAIAELKNVNASAVHLTLVAGLAGYLPNDASFERALTSLHTNGLVKRAGRMLDVSATAKDLIINHRMLLTNRDLAERVARALPKVAATMFLYLFNQDGAAVDIHLVEAACGLDPSDRRVAKGWSLLRELELIDHTSATRRTCSEMLYVL